jgi:ADP-ribose pyrophosphatase
MASKTVFKGKLFEIKVDRIQTSSGYITDREIVYHRGSVGIIPLIGNKIVMVRQFRYPTGRDLLEIPAGTLESDEDPIECAKRELIEETGYNAHILHSIGEIYLAPGYCTEKMYLYLAAELEQVAQLTEPDEEIDVELIDIEEVKAKISHGDIIDAKSISGIYLATPFFQSDKL